MLELTIGGIVYQFKAGIGFMYKADKRFITKDEIGHEKKVGLTYLIADIMDGNIEVLVDALLLMNEGQTPRASKAEIETYIEDENTDIDALFKEVLDFFEKSNCTKKTVHQLQAMIKVQEKQK